MGLHQFRTAARLATAKFSLRHLRDAAYVGISDLSRTKPELGASAKGVRRLRCREDHKGRPVISASPSDTLIAALGPIGQLYVKPRLLSHKLDLSYSAPLSAGAYDKHCYRHRLRSTASNRPALSHKERTLGFVLTQYLRSLHPLLTSCGQPDRLLSQQNELNVALLNVFDDETSKLLESKGWQVPDAMSWAWILTAESSEKAATRLMILASPSEASGAAIPTFVFLLLLRRRDMTLRALRLLIIHAWDRLLGSSTRWARERELATNGAAIPNLWSQRVGTQTHDKKVGWQQMSETTMITMIVRFLRHCRRLWPAASVNIAMMLTKFVDGTSPEKNLSPTDVLHEQKYARLTALYNRLLSLLSVPSSKNPMQSMAHYQRAQFTILRRMNEFKPSLAIDREGYRAVTRVQLAHRKTLRERQWASLKAKSWPPWKEEKTRLDVEIGPEHGVSRAGESIYRSTEAGYAPLEWESAAGILAGWDTDRSPTIQTRIVLPKPPVSRRFEGITTAAQPKQDGDTWAARIRATRTLDEGWLCFLAYKDQKGSPAQQPYYAMFEKIVFEHKRRRMNDPSKSENERNSSTLTTLAGDSKEVLPNPEDPRISVHTRIPPPSEEELYDTMIKDRVHPSGRFLAFLLSHAGSFRAGITYLKTSSLHSRTIKALFNQHPYEDFTIRAELEKVPDFLFAAHIRFLVRFSLTSSRKSEALGDDLSAWSVSPTHSHLSQKWTQANPTNSLVHAFRLMACRRPYYRPPWYSLLSALARAGIIVDTGFSPEMQSVQDILAWNVICDVLHQMQEIGLDLDLRGFQILCVAFEKVVYASECFIQISKKGVSVSDLPSASHGTSSLKKLDGYDRLRFDAEQVLLNGLPRVKKIFKDLVTSALTEEEIAKSDNDDFPKWARDHSGVAPDTLLPRLLEVPNPSQLHAFIRVLGCRADYAGILELVEWMSRFAPELKAVADEASNGTRMTRRCMIAIRVYLERSWIYGDDGAEEEIEGDGGTEQESAPRELIERVFGIIEGVEEWDGWPTDEQVEDYVRRARAKRST